MATVSDGTYSSNYAYVDNSPVVGQIDYRENSTTRMRTTKQYDLLNLLSSITSTSASPTISFSYEYNSGNQRVKTTLADGSYWVYTNLVAGMKWLQETYTQRYNSRHKVFGNLFQGQYRALPVDGDPKRSAAADEMPALGDG